MPRSLFTAQWKNRRPCPACCEVTFQYIHRRDRCSTAGSAAVPFTLTVEQPVPMIALMKQLEESDIHFEYNADELKAAGIDLEQRIQPDVKKMHAEVFFKSIFGPAGLDFRIDGLTVKLKPKRPAASKK